MGLYEVVNCAVFASAAGADITPSSPYATNSQEADRGAVYSLCISFIQGILTYPSTYQTSLEYVIRTVSPQIQTLRKIPCMFAQRQDNVDDIKNTQIEHL